MFTLACSLQKQIQEALKNDLARFQFEGREIKLDPRAGIFITMVSLPGSHDCCWQQGPWHSPAALTGTAQAAYLEHPGLLVGKLLLRALTCRTLATLAVLSCLTTSRRCSGLSQWWCQTWSRSVKSCCSVRASTLPRWAS